MFAKGLSDGMSSRFWHGKENEFVFVRYNHVGFLVVLRILFNADGVLDAVEVVVAGTVSIRRYHHKRPALPKARR